MIQDALVVLLVAGLCGLAWLLRPRQRMETGVRLLLAAFALLGAWSLWFGVLAPPGAEPAPFRFYKPTILYWTLAAILVAAPLRGWGYPIKAVIGTYIVFSDREWKWINRGFAAAFTILGGVNLFIALTANESDWEGFKWGCMVNLVAVFLLRLTYRWLDAAVRIGAYLLVKLRALLA